MAEVEAPLQHQPQQPNAMIRKDQNSKSLQRSLLVLNFIMLVIGSCGGPLLLRLYFLKGGRRKWLSPWLESAGWPIILVPLAVSYHLRRKTNSTRKTKTRPYLITPPIFLACMALGIFNCLINSLYCFGMSYLPVSTSSLLMSTQLGFTALFAFVLVKHKFTAFSINSVVLLSLGAVLLGVNSSGDRPEEEGRGKYYAGFIMMLGAAVLYGLTNPLVEAIYAKAEPPAVTYTLVAEMQMVMGIFTTALSTVGMLVNKDFQAIAREASEFELGEAKYYVLLISTAIIWQMLFLGTLGAIFYASALLAGIISAALIPVIELLAVIFFHESFTKNKGVALGLSLWGFVSYFYGEFKAHDGLENPSVTNPN